MARNKNKFRQELKAAFKEAELASTKAAISTNTYEDDSVETAAEKIAQNCARAYSEALLPKLANIIDDYVDSFIFDITKLKAPNGPCTGIITIMP